MSGKLLPVLVSLSVLLTQSTVRQAQATHAPAQLRVDQSGYGTTEAKQAILMTSVAAGGDRWTLTHAGRVVQSGSVAATSDRGSWNATYRHVYPISFFEGTAGIYQLQVDTDPVVRARVMVTSATSIYRTVLGYGVQFDQVQRDGSKVVPGTLGRKPAHLHDARASVYGTPRFNADDEITGKLTRMGGPVDVSGGWFDAGDYLKFTHTAAYADVILESAQRDLGRRSPSSLPREARFGIDWMSKMWNPSTRTLYLQVGIGNGTSDGKILGDHDLWRLPQADDGNALATDRFAAAHRPVFQASAPGRPISPNLAGRVAAAFALAAQNDATSNPSRARTDYADAAAIIGLADTASPPTPLTSALPNDFYPEDTWRDDMELGTAELALAAQRLHLCATKWLAQSARYARAYLAKETGDTFNLYDVSALAHIDLIRAIDATTRHHPAAGSTSSLTVTRRHVVNDLARQLDGAAAAAATDDFHAAGNVDDFDVDSHTFGIIASAGWYRRVTGSTRFDRLAVEQRNWLFGRNAWGASFMVGIGTSFPHCMQHQVANLSGSRDGAQPVAVGAVVNGPNGADNFDGGLGDDQDGMKHCAVTGYAPFDGHASRFVDDVRAWQTDEPAIDMTASAIAAAAAQLSVRPVVTAGARSTASSLVRSPRPPDRVDDACYQPTAPTWRPESTERQVDADRLETKAVARRAGVSSPDPGRKPPIPAVVSWRLWASRQHWMDINGGTRQRGFRWRCCTSTSTTPGAIWRR